MGSKEKTYVFVVSSNYFNESNVKEVSNSFQATTPSKKLDIVTKVINHSLPNEEIDRVYIVNEQTLKKLTKLTKEKIKSKSKSTSKKKVTVTEFETTLSNGTYFARQIGQWSRASLENAKKSIYKKVGRDPETAIVNEETNFIPITSYQYQEQPLSLLPPPRKADVESSSSSAQRALWMQQEQTIAFLRKQIATLSMEVDTQKNETVKAGQQFKECSVQKSIVEEGKASSDKLMNECNQTLESSRREFEAGKNRLTNEKVTLQTQLGECSENLSKSQKAEENWKLMRNMLNKTNQEKDEILTALRKRTEDQEKIISDRDLIIGNINRRYDTELQKLKEEQKTERKNMSECQENLVQSQKQRDILRKTVSDQNIIMQNINARLRREEPEKKKEIKDSLK
jgi:hypothetical protein